MATGLFSLEIGAALLVLLVTARLLSARRAAPAPPAQAKTAPKILDL